MASPPKKPRDIKNLKARLGRTITPGQAGLPGGVPTPGPSGPPGIGGAPRPGIGSAPGGAVRPVGSGPPGALRAPVGGPAAPARAAPAAAASPLGGQAVVAQEKKVTLVIDDSAVKDDEIGRKSRGKATALVLIGALLGLAVGAMVGSTRATNNQWNMAIADGKASYKKIDEVSKVVDVAKGHVKAAVVASQGGPGRNAHIDYKAIESLVALEKPFNANEFSRRRYLAFPPAVVDDLFDYYNHVNMLWDRFTVLGNKVAGKKRREALDKSAKAADGLLDYQFGMVLFKAGDAFAGGLVYMEPRPQTGEEEEGAAPVVMVSSRQGGRQVERSLFLGQEDLAESYGNYAFMLDKGRSMNILGEQSRIFAEVRGSIMEVNAIMTKASESQGRLLQELGKVAALQETFFGASAE